MAKVNQEKRRFLKHSLYGLSLYGTGVVSSSVLTGCSGRLGSRLQAADVNGVRLPAGFRSRVIAQSSQPVLPGQDYRWHAAPDGGACFPQAGGGWIYVSNSEMPRGGVGAIVFDAQGIITDAYSILQNTRQNCSGGATPWGSWLSCEEVKTGQVWECYPDGKSAAVVRPALGTFTHEAVAVDVLSGQLYLTEDKTNGCLYRFTADRFNRNGFPELASGLLEVLAEVAAGDLHWLPIPDPQALHQQTRYQQLSAKTFNGGEGIAYYDGQLVFTTKGDNRVWSYAIKDQQLTVLYDIEESLTPVLSGVDNVIVSYGGEIYVAEDGGDLQIVVIDKRGDLYPIVQMQGHDASELTGIAFSPDNKRLYFSSQRGVTGRSENGITYEITGPF